MTNFRKFIVCVDDLVLDWMEDHGDYELISAEEARQIELSMLVDETKAKEVFGGCYTGLTKADFNLMHIDADDYAAIYDLLYDGNRRIGFISGLTLLHRVYLTKNEPITIEVTTNRDKRSLDLAVNISVKKPLVPVTDSNWKYLQYIDLLKSIDKYGIPFSGVLLDSKLLRFEELLGLDPKLLTSFAEAICPKQLAKKVRNQLRASSFLRMFNRDETFREIVLSAACPEEKE